MAEVPVLEHGQFRLTQSGLILDYLAEQLGRFGPRDAAERRELWRWILWDNHKLSSYTATWRFLTSFARNDQQNAGAAGLQVPELAPRWAFLTIIWRSETGSSARI